MEYYIANELKKLDIEIGKKVFTISKEKGIKSTPSPLQARIIDYLMMCNDKDVTQKELEDALNVSKVAISGAIQSMEKNGIIERKINLNDARSKKIILTNISKQVHSDMNNVFSQLNKELIKGISKKELESFLEVIKKMQENIKE